MSNSVTTMCRPLQLSPARKAVVMCIADRADDAGVAWPSIPGICEWTCLSRTAVIDAMNWLEQAGLVSIAKAIGKQNVWTLSLAKIEALLPRPRSTNRGTDDQSAARTGTPYAPVRQTDPTRTSDAPPPVRQTDYTRTPGAPEASLSTIQAPEKHQKKSSKVKTSKNLEVLSDDKLPEWMPYSAWRSYVDMRVSIKSAMTLKAQELLIGKITKLRDAGHEPGALLEAATIANWKSVYTERAPNGAGANRVSFKERDERLAADRINEMTGGRAGKKFPSGIGQIREFTDIDYNEKVTA